MFEIKRQAGRLVEARVTRLASVERVDAYGNDFRSVIGETASRPILCADHRAVVIYSQPVADRLTELFSSLNQAWERVAIIVASTNATLAMQLTRIVRESSNPSRRVFFDPAGARDFLSEVLDPIERTRLVAFLDDR